MERERHARAKAIFLELLETAGEERLARAQDACAGDVELERAVQALLDAHAAPSSSRASTLTRAADALARAELVDAPSEPRAGDAIGGFRVLRVLGRGGMGVVLLAEQSSPRRTVALKVLRRDLAVSEGDGRRARFAQEARALARLDHPTIASVHAAGEHDDGTGARPWLAMEHVDGVPLADAARSLTLDRRVELVARLCDGVQHAHQRGILHRDLKPSNVLVDATGEPRILDFGVCRLLDDDATRLTRADDSLVGTIAYMSPEQLSGDALAVDARSDVYQLGLLAHELACGRPARDLAGLSTIEALRVARAKPPPSLSSVDTSIAGDLELVVAKALREDPEERYSSAAELALDLRRFLAREPVSARPRSAYYVLRLLVKRNKALSAAITTSIVSLVAGVAWSSRQTVLANDAKEKESAALADVRTALDEQRKATEAATRARDDAEAEARRVGEQLDWLRSMIASVDPLRDGREVTVYDVLGRGEKELDARFADDPRVRAGLFDAIGSAYLALSQHADAERAKGRAEELFEKELGPLARETLAAEQDRAEALHGMTRWDEARALFERVVAGRTIAIGEDARATLDARFLLAVLDAHQGMSERAADELTEVLDAQTRAIGADDPATLATEHALAAVELDLGRVDRAEARVRDVLERRARTLGPDHVDALCSEHELALLLLQRGDPSRTPPPSKDASRADLAAALELLERCAPKLAERLGPRDPQTWIALGSLANARRANGALEGALELYAQCEQGLATGFAPDHPETLVVRYNRARCLVELGRDSEAEPLARSTYEARARVLGAEHPQTRNARGSLAGILRRLGRDDEAKALVRDDPRALVTPP